MSMIFFAISILCFAPAISALAAPAVVYSCVMSNGQKTPIQCQISWAGPSDYTVQSVLFTLAQDEERPIDEKVVQVGTMEARLVIQRIICGDLSLTAPFDGVDSPKTHWKFIIRSKKIESVNPASEVIEN